jgi:hypothetical protein
VKRISPLAAAAALLALQLPVAGATLEILTFKTASGAELELAARAFQPGEPVMLTVRHAGAAAAVELDFLDQRLRLKLVDAGGEKVACLGIDLAAPAGARRLAAALVSRAGEKEKLQGTVDIRKKSFPTVRLKLAPKYVTPPPDALERIRRENEILGWIYGMVTADWLGDGPFIAPHAAPSWDNFGQRRINNDVVTSVHTGLDIRAPLGDPILAANAGRVVLASDLYMGGKTVVIDHGLGVFSSYGHLSEMLVRRGERVTKGQPVGKCGSTGRSTGPHLHWSARVHGSRVDPAALLSLPFPAAAQGPTSASGTQTATRGSSATRAPH